MLRGRQQPTVGYLAMQAKAALAKTRGVPGLSSELIGRESELAVMESAMQHLTAGVGRALLLVGEAGIGKSRLVMEMWKRRPRQCLWLEGCCLEMTTPISLWPCDHARAARYLIASGAKARRTFANETAIIYFRQALDHLAQTGDVRDEWKSAAAIREVWNQLGRSYHAAGCYQLAEEAFRQAIAYGEIAQLPASAIVRQIHWLLVGEAVFYVKNDGDELNGERNSGRNVGPGWEAGFYALGAIDRTLYPQSSSDGAAARFREIQLQATDLKKHR